MFELIHNMQQSLSNMGAVGLAIWALIEASCFPIPPDVLLIPMVIANPDQAIFLAFVCSAFSVVGGSIGYGIGKFGGRPILYKMFAKHTDKLEKIEKLYDKYGAKTILGAACTPIPYKLMTISSGVFKLKFIPFTLASIVGRSARFFIVATVIAKYGEFIKTHLLELGVTFSAFAFAAFIALKLRKKFSSKKQEIV